MSRIDTYLENITSVRVENEHLKQELSAIKNNSFFTSGMHSCECNSKNVTNEMKDFITDFTLRLFDLENQNASILSTVQNLERIRPKTETFMATHFDILCGLSCLL